jgi:nucleoside-diphosphate-sugar epimerase
MSGERGRGRGVESAPRGPLGAGLPVLVTGATGFFGGRLAAALVARGFRVRAMVRPTSDVRALTGLGVELARGDLLDEASLLRAAEGQRWVFHAAGRVSDWGARAAFEQANVVGTANVIAACHAAGVERLVHWSSLTVLGLPRDGRVVDECSTPEPVPQWDFYSATKLRGEALVRAAHGTQGLSSTVIRPGAIWGPGDPIIMPRIVRLLRRGLMPYIDGGSNVLGLSFVENLVEGTLLAAATPAAAGQVYHLTDGEVVTARAALDELADALGLRRPRLSVPYEVVYGLASVMERTARRLQLENPPPMTRYGVRFLSCDCRYEVGKAQRELGYAPKVSFREGVRRLAQSLAEA